MPVLVDHSRYANDDFNPPKKLDTDLTLTLELSNIIIKMPFSRRTRSRYSSSPPKNWWPKLIAKMYNENPVGPFAGNFDKPLSSNIRCGNSILTFKEFTEFRHEPEDDCHQYVIDQDLYFKLDDVSKIKSLTPSDKTFGDLILCGPASVKGHGNDLDIIVYTCVKNKCIFPCPCYLCVDHNPDECDHIILHPGFFDPKAHLYTVRNADSYDINWNEEHLTDGNKYCTNRKCCGCVAPHRQPTRGFEYRLSCLVKDKLFCLCTDCPYCKSLDVLKYAGTEQACASCRMKLVHHESYHLVYHYMCIFCRESLHKFKNIMSEKEYWDELEETRYEETISCQYCSRMFFDKQKKDRHIEIVHKENPDYLFKCNESECGRAFGSKQALNYHIERFHEQKDLNIPCQICEKTFKLNHNLDEHMRAVHSDVKFNCELCMAEFKRQSNLNHHYEVIHDTHINKLYLYDNPGTVECFQCSICQNTFREKRTLNHHVKIVHGKDDQPVLCCDLCDFTTIEAKTLNRHIRSAHEENYKYVCDKCDFKTKRKDTLKTHTANIHDKVPFLCCNSCDFTTIGAKTLNRHMRTTHEDNSKYACNQCDFKTKRKDTLQNHLKTIHEEIPTENYYCTLCDFTTKYKNSLFRHERNVHKSKQPTPKKKNVIHRCDQCEFRTLSLDMHLQHIDIKHIVCEKCEFKTTFPAVMEKHIKSIHIVNRRKRKATEKLSFDTL